MRKITVNDKVYEFAIGDNYAVIRPPGRLSKFIIPLDKLTGRSWDTIENARRDWVKGEPQDGGVTPMHIRNWILKERL